MIKLVAAVVFFLYGFKVIEDTEDILWIPIALGILAVGLTFDWAVGAISGRFHRE